MKQNKTTNHTPHENKMLFGPRISEKWLRIITIIIIILLRYLHCTETES